MLLTRGRYHSVAELLQAPTVEGLPHVDSSLRWVQGEDLFVLGANAALELGPGGANLIGAMRGARVVSNELHGLMRKETDVHARPTAPPRAAFSNKYAGLLDGSQPEIDVLANRLHLSPKAEMALRKASQHGTRHIVAPDIKPTAFRHRDRRAQHKP